MVVVGLGEYVEDVWPLTTLSEEHVEDAPEYQTYEYGDVPPFGFAVRVVDWLMAMVDADAVICGDRPVFTVIVLDMELKVTAEDAESTATTLNVYWPGLVSVIELNVIVPGDPETIVLTTLAEVRPGNTPLIAPLPLTYRRLTVNGALPPASITLYVTDCPESKMTLDGVSEEADG